MIPFFPRETLVIETGGSDALYYSEPFEMTPYYSMTVSFQVFGLIGTNAQLDLELQTADRLSSGVKDWQDAGIVFTAVTAAPSYERKVCTGANFGRFIRAQVKVTGTAGDVVGTVEVLGTARRSD
jgi:hypothetical protein